MVIGKHSCNQVIVIEQDCSVMQKVMKRPILQAIVLKTQSRKKRGGAGGSGKTVRKMMSKTSAFKEDKRKILLKGIRRPF